MAKKNVTVYDLLVSCPGDLDDLILIVRDVVDPKIPKSIIHMLAHIQFKEFHDFFLKRCHCCINLLALPFNSNHPQGFHFIYDFLHIMAFKPSRLVHDVFDL